MPNKKLNGSVDLLAQAMRQVFQESVEAVHTDMKEDLKDMGEGIRSEMKDMNKTTNENMQKMNKTTNENMQSQFAEQEKKIGQMLNPDKSA